MQKVSKMNIVAPLLLCVTLCVFRSCLAEPDMKNRESRKKLLEITKKKISPDIPPVQIGRNDVSVNLFIGPFSLLDLDDTTRTLSVRMYVKIKWIDENLIWNMTSFSNISRIEISQNKIWTPAIINVNEIEMVGTNFPVIVNDDGHVIWHKVVTSHILCKTDVSRYPFDVQKCFIIFHRLPDTDINLHVSVDREDHNIKLKANGEWELLEVTEDPVPLYPRFEIKLKRMNQFHILNLIFPMVLLSFVNTLVFLLPASSGEKMGFQMAVFVSSAVFLTLIHDIMPPDSDSISNLSLYLLLIQVQGFLSIVANIVVQNVYQHQMSTEKVIPSARRISTVAPEYQRNSTVLPQDDPITASKVDRSASVGKWQLDKTLDRIFFVVFFIFAFVSALFVFLRDTS